MLSVRQCFIAIRWTVRYFLDTWKYEILTECPKKTRTSFRVCYKALKKFNKHTPPDAYMNYKRKYPPFDDLFLELFLQLIILKSIKM